MNDHDTITANKPPAALSLAGTALFLDLDGTLAPIAARPQDVKPDARLTRLIERLHRGLQGRLAVLSGRTLADVDRILERRVPAVASVHGLIRRTSEGKVVDRGPHPGLPEAAEAIRAFARRDDGLLVEDKGHSIALHFRLAPSLAREATALAEALAARTGLVLQPGHMVVELRTPGPSKGDSLQDFMAAAPFAGAVPVFVGDDLTDEPAFRAAAALGGFGVLVGPARPTAARWRMEDVGAVLDWLEAAR
ncbi:MAG: trehalose-phosphatase [Phenylobacterium sp.]|jgi:trehalose 6-phosphate phosphatase|uniref:trehalose-phosphatase n=1 Tax=Phenylobacterium sp. TaxID=1871053 RepID=UPI002A35868F|nr:trehalose-phosphatase [Phenylobacterium sp.]MDX9998863.1 trehalose-phosphatase [Phenylobacterium sp.]